MKNFQDMIFCIRIEETLVESFDFNIDTVAMDIFVTITTTGPQLYDNFYGNDDYHGNVKIQEERTFHG